VRDLNRIVAAVAAAAQISCVSAALSEPAGPANPSILFFAGTDLWRHGQFIHGGALLSPAGLDADGFTLKLLFGGGRYTFASGSLGRDVDGEVFSAAIMPGWHFGLNGFRIALYAGADVQDHRLSPDDPGARLRGFYIGVRLASDIWYEPDARMMVAVNATLSSIGPTGSTRVALGWRPFAPVYFGPEAQMIWCGDFQQIRVGAHITGLRTDRFEWSAAGGWARDSDGRDGPYVRLGVIARY
jgi:hypothetical protein